MLASVHSLYEVDLISHAGSEYSGNDVALVYLARTVVDYSHALIPDSHHY